MSSLNSRENEIEIAVKVTAQHLIMTLPLQIVGVRYFLRVAMNFLSQSSHLSTN